MFWSDVESKVDTSLSSRKSGIITRAAGLRQAALDYSIHFEDTKSSITHPGSPPQPVSSSTDEAGKKQWSGFETEADPHDGHSESGFSSLSEHLSMGSKASPLCAPLSEFSTQEQPSSPGNSTQHEEPFTSSFDNSSAKEDMREKRLSAMVSLNQKTVWKVLDLDFLSKFLVFRDKPRPRFSLALDGVADVTQGSEFALTLTQEELTLANTTSTSDTDINARWPRLASILSRVCMLSHSYDDVTRALKKEEDDPIVDYLQGIVYHYSHHLKFADAVYEALNEREGFNDFTWPFIRGALTLVGIRSRCFEIPVAGTKERKNYGRDLVQETEEQALMTDGVAIFEGHQIYIAEAALVHEPKLEKKSKNKFKVVRCMRDSWNCQIRSIARESLPPAGLTVFGSTSYEDQTNFIALDFIGTYRLRQIGRMIVPVRKSHFGRRMAACVKTCLRFALDLEEETIRRGLVEEASEDLSAACDLIKQTRTTPERVVKRRRLSGIRQ